MSHLSFLSGVLGKIELDVEDLLTELKAKNLVQEVEETNKLHEALHDFLAGLRKNIVKYADYEKKDIDEAILKEMDEQIETGLVHKKGMLAHIAKIKSLMKQ